MENEVSKNECEQQDDVVFGHPRRIHGGAQSPEMAAPAFSCSLRIPALQRYNQEAIDRLKVLRVSEEGDLYEGLRFLAVVDDIIVVDTLSPRQFVESTWKGLLYGKDTDIEHIKTKITEKECKDLIFSHALRYGVRFVSC